MTISRLEVEAFIVVVRDEFSLSGDIRPGSLLVDELDLINLVAFSEELSGQVRTDGEFPVFVTMSDAYSYYTSLLEGAACQS